MPMFKGTGNIIYLNNDSFLNNKLKFKQKGLIMFGASWCKYCQITAPEFEKASRLLSQNFKFYYIDCEKYPDIAKKFNVRGFPTIKFVDSTGTIYKDYNNSRDTKSFLDTICLETSICKKYS